MVHNAHNVHNVHNAHNVYQSRKLRMLHGVCIARMVHNAHTRCNVCTLHHAIRGSRAREGVSLNGTTVSPAYCLVINSFLEGLHEKRGPGHHWRSPLVVLSLNTEGVAPCSFERRQGFLVLVLIDETRKGLFRKSPFTIYKGASDSLNCLFLKSPIHLVRIPADVHPLIQEPSLRSFLSWLSVQAFPASPFRSPSSGYTSRCWPRRLTSSSSVRD